LNVLHIGEEFFMTRTDRTKTIGLFSVIIAAALMCFAPFVLAQSNIRINGTAVGIGPRRTGTRSFTLIVNSYTTKAQAVELNRALADGGQQGLLDALTHLNAGRIQLGGGVGVRANAIIVEPWGDRGTHLTVFYERNISFYERRYGSRSEDYKIGYAEIFLDSRGRGEGTMIPAAKVRLRSDGKWEVEDFGTFPVRLMGLRASGVIPR
jgi:hypothetical protein